MESKIKRIRICWVSGFKIIKNSVYVVYKSGSPKTYLFDSLLDLPTTVLKYYTDCLEDNKYKFIGQSLSKTTGTVRTFILYDKTLEKGWIDL